MVTYEQLDQMHNTNLKGVEPGSLPDISGVTIRGESPVQRLESLLSQVDNPYCFRVGNTPVRVSFRENGDTLENSLRRYFLSLKN